jgi:hypothetical protein
MFENKVYFIYKIYIKTRPQKSTSNAHIYKIKFKIYSHHFQQYHYIAVCTITNLLVKPLDMGRHPDSFSLELKGARNSRTWVGEWKHFHLSLMVAEIWTALTNFQFKLETRVTGILVSLISDHKCNTTGMGSCLIPISSVMVSRPSNNMQAFHLWPMKIVFTNFLANKNIVYIE